MNEIETIEAAAEKVLKGNDRISPASKGQITTKIQRARQNLIAQEYTGVDEESRQAAIEKLDILTGRVQGSASFRALNLLSDVTKADKQLLEKIFIRLLDQYTPEDADKCIEMILCVLGPAEKDN